MANRCISFIEEVDREQEHAKRCARVKRSEEVYAAACDEAIQHGVTLTQKNGVYTMGDNRHTVWLYAATNTVFRKLVGAPRSEVVEGMPETDVYDMVLMFEEGRFL